MTNPLQITLCDMDRSEALASPIRRALQRLERLYSGIVGCRVVVEAPHHHQRQGRQFVVRLDLTVPGGEIVVNRDQLKELAKDYVGLSPGELHDQLAQNDIVPARRPTAM